MPNKQIWGRTMNRLSNVIGALLSLLALVVLVVALVLAFGGLQRGNEPSSLVSQSPIKTPNRSPGPPLGRTRLAETPGPNNWSAPTSLPDRGVRVGSPSKATISWGDVAIESLYNPNLDGDTLVANARVSGGVTIVGIDLKTGRVQRLSRVAERGIEEPHVSGRYVAWLESLSGPSGQSTRQVHVFDLVQARESTVEQGLPYQLDLRDDILVWQNYNGRSWAIYGYDLRAGREITVAEGPGVVFPHPCSREWGIYLQNAQEGWPGMADLRAHNLTTGEDISIGQMPFPRNASAGEQHACDGNRVAWVSVEMQQSVPIYKQHVYDLGIRSDRVLNMQVRDLPSVTLSGDILISSVGYDLAKDVPFSVFSNMLPEQFHIGSTLLLSKDKTVWLVDEPDGSQGIYNAPIVRK